jgi:hypothetical protein
VIWTLIALTLVIWLFALLARVGGASAHLLLIVCAGLLIFQLATRHREA